MTSPHLKAVIFDIGGVVLLSPFIAIDTYERDYGIPNNYINCSISARGSQGAWQRFERGELALFPFYEEFGRDLSDTTNGNAWYKEYCSRRNIECPKLPEKLSIDGRELFGRMMRDGGTYDQHILTAIHNIRATKRWKVLALTNNFSSLSNASPDPSDPTYIPPSEFEFLGWGTEGAAPAHLRSLFDDFCDSSKYGMRKPEPEFYIEACKRNDIQPKEAVFLDDIRMNLKAAQALGMETIHVPLGRSAGAIQQLQEKLGIDLRNKVTAERTKL